MEANRMVKRVEDCTSRNCSDTFHPEYCGRIHSFLLILENISYRIFHPLHKKKTRRYMRTRKGRFFVSVSI